MTSRPSLAELAAADIRLRPAEAVSVVAEICRQYMAGQLRAIPSPAIIRLTREGGIVAEGPMATEDAGVDRAAHLLNDLLSGFDAPAGYRVSGGLRLVMARALGTLDLPPYATLDEFCAALRRFALPDLETGVRGLVRAWERPRALDGPPVAAAPLTISDIRRARRATGVSLHDLADVAAVPAARVRELEWGYFRNWRADDEGRAQVVRYASAAGLDEQVVLSIVWPMIEEASAAVGIDAEPSSALVRVAPRALVRIAPVAPSRTRPALGSWALAAVAAGLLALATFAITGETLARAGAVRGPGSTAPPLARESVPRRSPAIAIRPAFRRPAVDGRRARAAAASHRARSKASPAPARVTAAPARAQVADAPEPADPEVGSEPASAPRRPLLSRELFRIVIR